ncbi:testis-specific expressed protein 55-like [Halichondria panicea]|uniref:testis-specific expressed protein 55-like n=1 Tax=Halichondria panicea TaxID=6063 RepID=UPI00312BB3C0
MSAKDNEGCQAFSQATDSVPSREHIEQAAAIAANVIDGQKSIGQSMQDPYTASVHYLEKHRIVEIFQNLTSRIAYERPEDPLEFMLTEIDKVKNGEKLPELKTK